METLRENSKKMQIIHPITYWLVFLLMLTTGCSREELVSSYSDGKFHSQLLFNVTQPTTRSSSFEDEVKRLDIMLFKEGKLEKVMRKITSFTENPDGSGSVEISFDEEGVRQAYVIANIDDESWLDRLVEGVTPLDYIHTIQTRLLTQMAQPPLVMYGVSVDIDFSTAGSTTVCELYRAVARIDVINTSDNFTLLSARMIRSKKNSMVFPGESVSASDVADFEPIAASDGSVRLYSYENPDTNPESATTLEVNGLVNNTSLSYIVDFSSDGKQIPIGRNYRYTVNVNDVRTNTIAVSISVLPWKEGEDINEVVSGNKPTVDVQIDPVTGTYSAADSSFTLTPQGGQIRLLASANADCEMNLISDGWLEEEVSTRTASSINSEFVIRVKENLSDQPRVGEITISNKLSKKTQQFTLRQKPAETATKYMVVLVAGQSNAVGYDQSPVDAEDLRTDPRAVQLSYRRGVSTNPEVIPLTWCADDIDARKESAPNESGQKGLKGIHLPLAKELLKYIPAGYQVLVVPVSYASSRFSSNNNSYGSYNSATLAPNEMGTALRWGVNSAYCKTIVERTKYALNMDPGNKFLGFVWCQGENDRGNADYHYTEFTTMTDAIFRDLNSAGYGNRTNYGVIDKRSWFTYSSCSYWVDWFSSEDASAVFGGYKQWNPDNFVHIPFNTPSNPEGGPGMGKYHFGKGAYRNTVAPMVAARMNENGVLFNGISPKNNHFTDQTTPEQAQAQGGSKSDADVQNGLILSMPFSTSSSEVETGNASAAASLSLVRAQGLVDINGTPRSRMVLALSGGSVKMRYVSPVNDWSVAFLFKRTGNQSALQQKIISTTGRRSPFIGFKEYSAGNGVAKAAEFVVEPIVSNTKAKSLAGQFMAANQVRSMSEWIHYMVTYNSKTQMLSIYMNGTLVRSASVPTSGVTNFTTFNVGADDETTARGEMADLMIWNRVLASSTLKKVFLMSYYGYTK